jgi:hypothetical protein
MRTILQGFTDLYQELLLFPIALTEIVIPDILPRLYLLPSISKFYVSLFVVEITIGLQSDVYAFILFKILFFSTFVEVKWVTMPQHRTEVEVPKVKVRKVISMFMLIYRHRQKEEETQTFT